jgi:hypothetical protein
VPQHQRALEPERIDHAGQIGRLGDGIVPAARVCRAPMAAGINHDDVVA